MQEEKIMKNVWFRKAAGLAAAVVLAGALTACGSGNGSAEKSGENSAAQTSTAQSSAEQSAEQAEGTQASEALKENTVVKLGVVGENNEQWQPVIDKLAEEGITLELVKFSDYALPNVALNDGDIDLDAFQHYAYFNNQVKEQGLDLTVIGETIIAPLGVYSDKISSLDELKDGDQIAIPNDPTNGGRSLKVLEAAGLIEVDPEAGYVPELKDITSNPKNLEFVEVEAAQTASLLPDVAAAVINGGHAVDNGLNPQKDSLYLEEVTEGSDNPYINVIAVRTADKDNALYQKIVEYFRSDEVAKVIEEAYKGAYIPAWK